MQPLVSCIMPTANRRAFVPQAVRYFLRQDYDNKELVIVDDGGENVADLIPNDLQVRYLRMERKVTLGEKRNECVKACRGDLILHWDDDDWMAPWRIRYQVEQLLQEGAEVCGLRQMLFYDPNSRNVWLYEYPPKQRPWLAGGSLLYTRDFWLRAPFPHIQVGSDTRFILSRQMERYIILPDYKFYVALIHPKNTSRKQTVGAYWKRWAGDLKEILGNDYEYYAMQPGCKTDGIPVNQPQAPRTSIVGASFERKASNKLINRLQAPSASIVGEKPRNEMLVTVSIPYFRCHLHIRRAVESILTQTHQNLQVIVVNDGDEQSPWGELAHIEDPRLIRFDLKANHGRYFADAVVLNAIDSPYFVVQDADDWSEPQRIAVLLRALREMHADVAVSTHYNVKQQHSVIRQKPLDLPLTEKFTHRGWHHGLFKSESLRNIGGYYGGFRIAYDIFLMNMLLMTGRVVYVDQPLYNHRYREESLENSAATGMSSAARAKVHRLLGGSYAEAFKCYTAYLKGEISSSDLATVIREISARYVTEQDWKNIDEETQRLKTLLKTPHQANLPPKETTAIVVQQRPSVQKTGLEQLLDSSLLQWKDWAISKTVAVEVFHRLQTLKPKRILEIGSGESTVLLAKVATEIGAQVTVLEHDPLYFQRTSHLLEHFGLRRGVNLILAPLTQRLFSNGGRYFWYEATLVGKFDFVFVDGPPQKYGRQAVLFALADHLAPVWELWLHDGHRTHEQTCLELWNPCFPFFSMLYDLDEKGVWLLSSAPQSRPYLIPPPQTSSLGLSLLTGHRLDLLKQMIASLQKNATGILEQSYVLALINGRDPATDTFLKTLPFINQIIRHTGDILPIGTATTLLMQELSHQVEYLIHLEDDWCVSSLDMTWVETATSILKAHPHIGQVRLRHRGENVLRHHMITHKPIHWEGDREVLVADQAHFTFNPHMLRSSDVPKVYPCQTELDAQRRFLNARLASAQLSPGIFRHIGAAHSLRQKLRVETKAVVGNG